MNPELWGPKYWDFLYEMAFKSPHNFEQYDFIHTVKDIVDNLPCRQCSVNITKHWPKIQKQPDAVQFILTLHNLVREDQHKKPFSYNEVVVHFTNHTV